MPSLIKALGMLGLEGARVPCGFPRTVRDACGLLKCLPSAQTIPCPRHLAAR
jgi:hypothetical protein